MEEEKKDGVQNGPASHGPDDNNDTILPQEENTASLDLRTKDTEMEVHHHAHHENGKKSWRSYFWEFLMLFLAVFCGSLAEYQLEHYVEKQRAKDFSISLHHDLTADTGQMAQTVVRLKLCVNKIDTLVRILADTKHLQENTTRIYQLSVYAFIFPVNTPNESTLQQLLNSGSLRYFKNVQLVDSIKRYSNDVQALKKFSESGSNFNLDFRKIQLSVIDIDPIIKYIPRTSISVSKKEQEESDSFFTGYTLLTTDALRLKEYANWCSLKRFYMLNSVVYYKAVIDHGRAILKILDK